jgi:hypothetical protein
VAGRNWPSFVGFDLLNVFVPTLSCNANYRKYVANTGRIAVFWFKPRLGITHLKLPPSLRCWQFCWQSNSYEISVSKRKSLFHQRSFPHGERLNPLSKFRHNLSQRPNFLILGFCICFQFLIQPLDGRQCHPRFVNRADGLFAVSQSTSGEKPMTWRNGGAWCISGLTDSKQLCSWRTDSL